jgi:hypothetical protein
MDTPSYKSNILDFEIPEGQIACQVNPVFKIVSQELCISIHSHPVWMNGECISLYSLGVSHTSFI